MTAKAPLAARPHLALKPAFALNRWPAARGRPPEPTNGSFMDAKRDGSKAVVRQLRSGPSDWYGSWAARHSLQTKDGLQACS